LYTFFYFIKVLKIDNMCQDPLTVVIILSDLMLSYGIDVYDIEGAFAAE